MKYSVIIPCYKSEKTLEKVVKLLQLEFQGESMEVILVNDGSPDGGKTFEKITKITFEYDNVIGIDLAKNVGQHNAVMCGLNQAQGDFIIAMDDDMQTHPSQIYKLIEEIQQGYDVVYAYYPHKKHGIIRNLGSWFNSFSVKVLINKPKGLKTSSFWIIRKFVRDSVIQYQNANAYLQGLFLRTTNHISCIPVEHFEREAGCSGYSFKSLVRLWSNIIGFSVVPLRIASLCGAFSSVVGMVGAFIILIRKLFFHITAQGWASVMVAIFFFSGLILMFMGLIGEYIGRLFLASNNQPQYVIRNIVRGN